MRGGRGGGRDRVSVSGGVGRHSGGSSGGKLLLLIAHRLDTVMGADSLLVMGAGRLLEQGAPGELAVRLGGVFSGMMEAASAPHVPPASQPM